MAVQRKDSCSGKALFLLSIGLALQLALRPLYPCPDDLAPPITSSVACPPAFDLRLRQISNSRPSTSLNNTGYTAMRICSRLSPSYRWLAAAAGLRCRITSQRTRRAKYISSAIPPQDSVRGYELLSAKSARIQGEGLCCVLRRAFKGTEYTVSKGRFECNFCISGGWVSGERHIDYRRRAFQKVAPAAGEIKTTRRDDIPRRADENGIFGGKKEVYDSPTTTTTDFRKSTAGDISEDVYGTA